MGDRNGIKPVKTSAKVLFLWTWTRLEQLQKAALDKGRLKVVLMVEVVMIGCKSN